MSIAGTCAGERAGAVLGGLLSGLAALLAGCSSYSGMLVNSVVSDKGILFARLNDQGLHRSADVGATWTPLIAAGHESSKILQLVTSGDILYGLTEKKTLISTDRGASWSETGNAPTASRTTRFICEGGRLWAGTFDGLWRSTDGGRSWISVGAGQIRRRISDIVACDSVLLVYAYDVQRSIAGDVASGAGTFRSTDFGTRWTEMDSVLTNFAVLGKQLYALGGNGAVRVSGDCGGNWKELPRIAATPGGFESHFFQLVACGSSLFAAGFAPAYDGRVLHGVFRSIDGGNDWAPVRLPGEFAWDWLQPLAASDTIVIINGGRRAVLSRDEGATWSEVTGGE